LAVAVLLAAAQARFAGHLGLPLGLAATAALAPALTRLRAPAGRALAAAGLLAVVALPQRAAARPVEVSERALADSFDVLLGLRARAGASGEAERGVVLAEWSFGHYVQYYGRHPAAVDNFGDWLADLSLPRRVLLAESEAEAEALLDRAGVRYLLVGELAETLSGLLPTEAERARLVAASRPAAGGRLAIDFRPAILSTVLYRAARQLGTAALAPDGRFVPPLRGLRLVEESARGETLGDGRELPVFKLYERVRGARLVVRGLEPTAEVSLEAELASPRGRLFPWLDVVPAGADGVAELRFPYSTGAARGVRPLAIRVRAGEREIDVREIPERAAREGLVLELGGGPTGAALSRAESRGRG
ncbi:MAG: Oligosaccharyl transferase, subunit, partial [Acidobacteria bacterium]|nr:Oligosaccharyl transferase, subunit [Acidobacteriota bacterium]